MRQDIFILIVFIIFCLTVGTMVSFAIHESNETERAKIQYRILTTPSGNAQ